MKKGITLTEDRTLKYSFDAERIITVAIANCEDRELIKRVLQAPENTFESLMQYKETTDTFLDVVLGLVKNRWTKINPSAMEIAKRQLRKQLIPEQCKVSEINNKILAKAIKIGRAHV